MNRFKKLITSIVLSAVCITTVIAPTSAYASEVSSEIGVTAAATMLDVTITPSVAITVDPTDPAVPSGNITIRNNTVAPVIVTLTSLTTDAESDFALVAPDAFADWSGLNKAESLNVALRLTPSGWTGTGTFYSGPSASFVGTLGVGGQGSFDVAIFRHGRAFDDVKTAKFNISFVVELA